MKNQLLRLSFFIILVSILFFPAKLFSQFGNDLEEDTSGFSIKYFEKIDPGKFDTLLFEELLIKQLNKQIKIRYNREPLTTERLLHLAAVDQALFMAEKGEADLYGEGKKTFTADRVEYYGGSRIAEEIVNKVPYKKGKEAMSYKEVADDIVFKWLGNSKSEQVLKNPNYIFIGVGTRMDQEGKKIFVSAVFSNYKLFNEGQANYGELPIPFSIKSYGLKPYDARVCRKCEKFQAIGDLQKGLFVEDNKIYFRHNNIKEIKKLIRNPKDGLAVDIVQKNQYPCNKPNIVDNNLINKGVLLKPLWCSQIYKKNRIKGKRVKKLEVCLGTLPENLTGDYELNLLVIQEKLVCRNLSRPYVLEASVAYTNDIDILADSIEIPETSYTPSGGTNVLTFKIPFEKNKSVYKPEDIEPFLKSLNEPEFTINEVNIHAFSSIEGTEHGNKTLQKDRAESIIKTLKSRQKGKIKTAITTGENWDEFKKDVTGTEFSNLSGMTLAEAQRYISTNNLEDKLELYLKNHRYANIEMKVTYDIGGDKEQQYVVSMFNKAVQQNDREKALSIQKYIIKKMIEKKYNGITAAEGSIIPEKMEFAGLLMNKLWMEKYAGNEPLDDDYCNRINNLYKMDPSNNFIYYNQIYCNIVLKDIGEPAQIEEKQEIINKLYETNLSKQSLDLLNLEYQFKIIKTLDTLGTPHPLMIKSLNKIKEIVNIKESNWQNALKLTYLFINQKDYDFAARLLEPFLEEEPIFEELLFTYLSLCTEIPHRIISNNFVEAMKRASEMNKERYCQLFDGTKFSFQIFENPKVKEDYCKICK